MGEIDGCYSLAGLYPDSSHIRAHTYESTSLTPPAGVVSFHIPATVISFSRHTPRRHVVEIQSKAEKESKIVWKLCLKEI